MKKYIAAIVVGTALLCTSCNDWLDVQGENFQKEEDQFSTYGGFKDALVGAYMCMADQSVYGLNMTMTTVEVLANAWYCPSASEDINPAFYYLNRHDYDNDNALSTIQSMYQGLFTTIAQANMIIKYGEENGSVITSSRARSCIVGEAYAIRAYCQLDLLRIFGQLPNGATKNVSLPYSYTTSLEEIPAYYSFDKYVENLEKDLNTAESLLKDNDPIFDYSYAELNGTSSDFLDDDFFYYRQSRLNYWAVRALQARMYLYTGNTTRAHEIAMEIINAKDKDGNAVIELSGVSDLGNDYYALPSECLFYLSKYDINSYANDVLIGGRNTQAREGYYYYLSNSMLQQLYASINAFTASHNRYTKVWNRNIKDPGSQVCPTLKKYWYDEDEEDYLATKHQIIPMLRLSEIYLIAMETSTSLTEVNALYSTYMRACSVNGISGFSSLDDMKTELINEYRREFYGEGQMFYVYKRTNAAYTFSASNTMSEDSYIVPLPATEYNRN